MSSKHMKRCSASQIVSKMQIKTAVRQHLACVGTVETASAGEDTEKRDPSARQAGMCNAATVETSVVVLQKRKHGMAMRPSEATSGATPRGRERGLPVRPAHTHLHGGFTPSSQEVETTPMSTDS